MCRWREEAAATSVGSASAVLRLKLKGFQAEAHDDGSGNGPTQPDDSDRRRQTNGCCGWWYNLLVCHPHQLYDTQPHCEESAIHRVDARNMPVSSKPLRHKWYLAVAICSSIVIKTSSLSLFHPPPPLNHLHHRHIGIRQRHVYVNNHIIAGIGTTTCTPRGTSVCSRYLATYLQSTSSPSPNNGDVQTTPQSAKHVNALSKTKDLSIPAVLLASFLNLLGFTMASPIQPALGEHFSLPLGASFGSLSSAYPLGMMLGVFMWPTLSDVVGRKIVMALTLFGSGMGLMLQSWGIQRCWTLEQFLAARVLTGCFAGNSPISKAYLADRGSEGEKGDLTNYLSWKDAASTLAFIVGPVLGGLLYQGGKSVVGSDNSKRISFVIRFSALASLLASTSIMLFVKNTEKDINLRKAPASNVTTNDDDSNVIVQENNFEDKSANKPSEIIACPLGTKLWTGVVTVAAVSALYHAADSAFFAFFPSLLQQRLKLDTQSIGMAFTSFAFISFTMSAFVSSRFIKRWGPVAACSTGLGAIGTALWSLGYAASLPIGVGLGATSAFFLAAAALYYTGVPLYGPTIPTMLLQCVPSHKRGAVMGFDGTINTLARVISPLVMGEIHRQRGAGACFKVAGSCVYAGLFLALSRRWLVLRKEFAKTQTVDANAS